MGTTLPLNEIEKHAIVDMLRVGYEVAEIKEKLDRGPTSRAVERFIEENNILEEVEKECTPRDSVDDQLENWQGVVEELLERLKERGVDPNVAQDLVKFGLNKVDLSQEPSVEALESHAMTLPETLMNVKKYGNSSVVSMNTASSAKNEGVERPEHESRSSRGAIFSPKSR